MGKTVTETTIAVKIHARDSPSTLRSTLSSLHNDISKGCLSISVVLIDDSQEEANQNLNKSLLKRTFEKTRIAIRYFGKKELVKTLDCIPENNAHYIFSQIGMLGSSNYQPSRAKNVSQLINTHADYELLLDDDILIDPKNESKISTVEMTLNKARTNNAYVSANLMGSPDVSCIQLLERSITNPLDKLHVWNDDPSNFSLSGGYLLYPNIETLPMFPKTYNEDFVWVAYGMEKFHMNADKLFLNVYHSPIEPKTFSTDRLIYEATGEILFETLRLTNRNSFIERHVPPSRREIETAINDYLEYVNYVLTLTKKRKNYSQIDSELLGKTDLGQCVKILIEHSRYIQHISYLRI